MAQPNNRNNTKFALTLPFSVKCVDLVILYTNTGPTHGTTRGITLLLDSTSRHEAQFLALIT